MFPDGSDFELEIQSQRLIDFQLKLTGFNGKPRHLRLDRVLARIEAGKTIGSIRRSFRRALQACAGFFWSYVDAAQREGLRVQDEAVDSSAVGLRPQKSRRHCQNDDCPKRTFPNSHRSESFRLSQNRCKAGAQ